MQNQHRRSVQFLVCMLTFALIECEPCTVKSIEDLNKAIGSCDDIILSNVKVPPGQTLNLTDLKPRASVLFEGTTEFGYEQWTGPLIRVSGVGIRISGAPGHVINGNGALWWDALGKPDDPKKKQVAKIKPKFITLVGVNDSIIHDLFIKDAPMHCMTLYFCNNVTIINVTIDNSAGDVLIPSFGKMVHRGHNTDGFDIGKNGKSHNITITSCKVINQDDCLAVNAGSDIVFKNNFCSGGHGISIGSVGGWLENEVDRVTVDNCTVVNSANGIRIKTKRGTTGRVSNVTFSNIRLDNITSFGIVVRGNYHNGGPSGSPSGGVPIIGLTMKNIYGTVAKRGANVFVSVKNASDWVWSNITLTGGSTKVKCKGIPEGSGASCDLK